MKKEKNILIPLFSIFILGVIFGVSIHIDYLKYFKSTEKVSEGFTDIPLQSMGFNLYRAKINDHIVCNIEKNNYEMIRCTTYREVEK